MRAEGEERREREREPGSVRGSRILASLAREPSHASWQERILEEESQELRVSQEHEAFEEFHWQQRQE
jgi:hypothetical protein